MAEQLWSPRLVLPVTGPGEAVLAPDEPAVAVPGWDVVNTFVERFAPGLRDQLATDFAGVVAEWEAVPTNVVYAVTDGRDVLAGLSYQTKPSEVLHAVWSGFCVAIARVLQSQTAEPLVIESAHPGAGELARCLANLGVEVAGGVTGAVDHQRAFHLDSLARDVAEVAGQ